MSEAFFFIWAGHKTFHCRLYGNARKQNFVYHFANGHFYSQFAGAFYNGLSRINAFDGAGVFFNQFSRLAANADFVSATEISGNGDWLWDSRLSSRRDCSSIQTGRGSGEHLPTRTFLEGVERIAKLAIIRKGQTFAKGFI